MLANVAPYPQVAAIRLRLGGAAKELARTINLQEMVFGGMRNGHMLDPVTYLIGVLHNRLRALDEEARWQSMTERSS